MKMKIKEINKKLFNNYIIFFVKFEELLNITNYVKKIF